MGKLLQVIIGLCALSLAGSALFTAYVWDYPRYLEIRQQQKEAAAERVQVEEDQRTAAVKEADGARRQAAKCKRLKAISKPTVQETVESLGCSAP